MRARLVVVLGIVLLLCGCAPQGSGIPAIVPPAAPIVYAGSEPGDDNTWIRPAIVRLGNFEPGDTAEYSIEVHNGKSVQSMYHIAYRVPDRTYEGFVPLDAAGVRFVTIEPMALVLGPRETRMVLITVTVPKYETPPVAWEFWISVVDTEATGLIQHELCSRWTVMMKE
jgi:catechol 2,3-dioxygenase-like lactoylglutathione lyase family enzyme